ncbi:histidine kinase [Flavihumibacter rivuli]|uniref:ligand-binding sensor domain-containing protein n=1 Tax=Flavihumibacter rivuli TaxID=2838156 RepID=UPI001BDDEBD9|nr:two-component regulator propeller domain-containing protein [Flavihumibacter rivuli]ULQ56719.1 histidine kinase [Flavihumibacter rivuli]
MRRISQIILLVLHCLVATITVGQSPTLNVHHLSTAEGLGDGVVRAIGQDAYGFIWIGTVSGLSRFDGRNIKLYQTGAGKHKEVPFTVPRCITSDSSGNLWIGFNKGLYRFDYPTDQFQLVPQTADLAVTKIIPLNSTHALILTSAGVKLLDLKSLVTRDFKLPKGINQSSIDNNYFNDLGIYKDKVYLTTRDGFYEYSLNRIGAPPTTIQLAFPPPYRKLAISKNGTFWISHGRIGARIMYFQYPEYTATKEFNALETNDDEAVNNNIMGLLVDAQGKLWATSNSRGITSFDPSTGTTRIFYNQPGQFRSLGVFHANEIFQDKNGFIWLGTEGYGVDYFHPDNNLFQIINPNTELGFKVTTPWARMSCEDRNGNIWMTWAGGLTVFSKDRKYIETYENLPTEAKQLHNNSVRSIIADKEGNIWIGTSRGVNCKVPGSSKLKFFFAKDSLPEAFYWSIMQDGKDTIWFGADVGLFYRVPSTKKIYSIRSHPILKDHIKGGVRTLYEDSKGRKWFGLNGQGLLLYDPVNGRIKKWERTEKDNSGLLGNVITAIREDKKGIIWMSSFVGLVAYDPAKDRFSQFSRENGLPSIKTSGLLVDDQDRLWVGTTAGLAILDSNRQNFSIFDLSDGLPTMEFSDMPATALKSGEFIFPTINGFILFNPNNYSSKVKSYTTYLSSIKVFNQPFSSSTNVESLKSIYLKPDQNFFSLQLVALNYNNPQQTWYAYKLDGLEANWVITKANDINYTNVPGGTYTFRYKASSDPNNWNVPEKQLQIKIGTVFYKTLAFLILCMVLIAGLIYAWYLYRLKEQRNIYALKAKAQNLEKEKTVVMYESLKQQLNPHFLFNSLSSLGSLIRTDQAMAQTFLENLSKTYRYLLQSRDHDLISLEEEVKFAQSYTKLIQTRFGEGLVINYNVDKQHLSKNIVPVTLQNLIDNVIKHNIIDIDSPLVVDIFTENNYLVIRNNLQKKNFVETSNKQGLNNLQSLYRYLTNDKIIIDESNGYFTIKIPLI